MRNTRFGRTWVHWRFALASFLFWALVLWLQAAAVNRGSNEAFLDRQLWEWVAYSALHGLLTVGYFEFSHRLLRRQVSRARYVLVLLTTLVVAAFLQSIGTIRLAFGSKDFDAVDVFSLFVPTALQHGAMLGAGAAVNAFLVAERRQREVVDAQLRMLRGQLQPHFLFNTLQSISATVKQDGDGARKMIALLGDLLRQTLRERESRVITLEEERGLLEPYVALQQLRFGDRLRVEYDLTDETCRAAVPDLLLQPLVENAIQHSVERDPGPAVIRIRARRQGASLELEVADDGSGPGPGSIVDGVGLGATRSRLQALYGSSGDLRVERGVPKGAVVTISIPWQEARLVA